MRILFDQGVPLPLRVFLPDHQVQSAFRRGWANLKNGQLISAAEGEFDLIVTTDKNWKYQQRVTDRTVGILVLSSPNWPELRTRIDEIVLAINRARPGDYVEL